MSLELVHRPARSDRPVLRVILATTEAELDAVFALRRDIYVHELGILPADHPYVTERGLVDPYDAWSANLLLLAGDEPIGTTRLTQAMDGPLELEEYVDLGVVGIDRAHLADGTRFMVKKSWRRTEAGPLLALASWRLLKQGQASVLLLAGKTNNLGRYYKNAGFVPVEDVAPFTYELTGCTYELIAADIGGRRSQRRLRWTLWAALVELIGIRLGAPARRLLRRGFSRPQLVLGGAR